MRTKGQRYHGAEFEDIVVVTRPDGTSVALSDVATVIDGFEDRGYQRVIHGSFYFYISNERGSHIIVTDVLLIEVADEDLTLNRYLGSLPGRCGGSLVDQFADQVVTNLFSGVE